MHKFKNIFIELVELKSSHVTFGDTFKILVKGKGILILFVGEMKDINLFHTSSICKTWKYIYILNSGQLLEGMW